MYKRTLARIGWMLLALLAGSYPAAGWAIEKIQVVALFKERAVVMIDGSRHLLRRGETSPQGVKLVSADSTGAVLEYQGRTLRHSLDGGVYAAGKPAKSGKEVHIFRNTRGMFYTVGSINGLPVNFLVDTGASSVAMNSGQARRLGIDFRVEGDPTYVSTASAVERAYKLKLDVVKVGDIQLRNVDAVIMEGAHPTEVLLGMSFLGRLNMNNQGEKLVLRRKF